MVIDDYFEGECERCGEFNDLELVESMAVCSVCVEVIEQHLEDLLDG